MQKINIQPFLLLVLGVLMLGVGASAYSEPFAPYPANTQEPIDISLSNQAKTGALSVNAFFARGNADFKKDLSIKGVAQGCAGWPCDVASTNTKITIGNNTIAKGELYALNKLAAGSLKHTESAPKPVCADSNGIVVFCSGGAPNDLCSNIPGVQASLGTDLIVENTATPTICTQVIRGVIDVGQYGAIVRNMANNAELANLWIKNLTITSVGGQPITTWPSNTPLLFRWGYCAKWNSNYSGPNSTFYNVQGSTASGSCADFKASYPYRSGLTYGFSGHPDSFYGTPYVAYDGTTQIQNTFNNIPYPKGFFDAVLYGINGAKTGSPNGYTVNLWYKKNNPSDAYRNIKLPLEKLILYDVKVPSGYILNLTSTTAQTVEVHLAP